MAMFAAFPSTIDYGGGLRAPPNGGWESGEHSRTSNPRWKPSPMKATLSRVPSRVLSRVPSRVPSHVPQTMSRVSSRVSCRMGLDWPSQDLLNVAAFLTQAICFP